MEKVGCYRDGTIMRWIPRLKVYFCDNDGYILGEKDAIMNNLVVIETPTLEAHHGA